MYPVIHILNMKKLGEVGCSVDTRFIGHFWPKRSLSWSIIGRLAQKSNEALTTSPIIYELNLKKIGQKLSAVELTPDYRL